MKKPESLRKHLVDSIIDLRRNPDRLLTFIDAGRVRCTAAHGLSYEYSYTLNLIFTDYTGSPDAIMIALLGWLRIHQNEIIANLERGKDAIQFEADILDNHKVDFAITLPLTERVIVKPAGDNSYTVDHPPEPPLTDHLDAGHWIVRDAQGYLIAEWDSTEPTGSDIETPHPAPSGSKPNWFDSLTTGDIIQGDDD